MDPPKVKLGYKRSVLRAKHYFPWKGKAVKVYTRNDTLVVATDFEEFENPVCCSYKRDALFCMSEDCRTLVTDTGRVICHEQIYIPVFSADYYMYTDESRHYCAFNGEHIELPEKIKDYQQCFVDDRGIYLVSENLIEFAPITDGKISPYTPIGRKTKDDTIIFSPYGMPIIYRINKYTSHQSTYKLLTLSGEVICSDDDTPAIGSMIYATETDVGFNIIFSWDPFRKDVDTKLVRFEEEFRTVNVSHQSMSVRRLYDNPDLFPGDVTINCVDGTVSAHKTILVIASDVLMHILTNDRFERVSELQTDHTVRIVDLVIRYIYGADFKPTPVDLVDLLVLADTWMMQSLFSHLSRMAVDDHRLFITLAKEYPGPLPQSVLTLLERLMYPYKMLV